MKKQNVFVCNLCVYRTNSIDSFQYENQFSQPEHDIPPQTSDIII